MVSVSIKMWVVTASRWALRDRSWLLKKVGLEQSLCKVMMGGLTGLLALCSLVVQADDLGLVYRDDRGTQTAPLLSTDVTMAVNGLVNRVTVRQTFKNTSTDWIHGRYIFPLPDKAAVDHLRLWIGERFIEGDIQPKLIAKKQYEAAQQAGVKASLVEQHRPNIFSTQVANIAPDESVTVEIEYQEAVLYRDGEFNLRFPTVVAPRYIPNVPLKKVPDTNAITPFPRDPQNDPALSFSLNIDLNAGLPVAVINTPSHAFTQQKLAEDHYMLSMAQPDIADRDVVLSWRPQATDLPSTALFTQHVEGQGYGLLLTMPPQVNNQANSKVNNALFHQSVTFVLDISGSMHGESIEQAKQALKYGLQQLQPEDSFNIVTFNHEAMLYSEQLLPVTPLTITRALRFVAALQADGGTEMAAALKATFSMNTNNQPDRPNSARWLDQIVFITDGSVGNETALFELIEQQLADSRLFTVGIGSAPNSYFMTRAAMKGKGTYTYIGDVKGVDIKMRALFSKISQPVMRDIKLTWSDGRPVDYWPNPVPDLYQQEPLQVTFKIPENAANLVITGQQVDHEWHHEVDVYQGLAIDEKQPQSRIGLDILWARNQISSVQMNPGISTDDKKTHIEQLGMKHHIVTPYTSLIAVDKTPARSEGEEVNDANVKPHVPKGWKSKQASLQPAPYQLAQTGTNSEIMIFVGALLSLFALLIGCISKNRITIHRAKS
jgi:Ca-activated chloride channel homolog